MKPASQHPAVTGNRILASRMAKNPADKKPSPGGRGSYDLDDEVLAACDTASRRVFLKWWRGRCHLIRKRHTRALSHWQGRDCLNHGGVNIDHRGSGRKQQRCERALGALVGAGQPFGRASPVGLYRLGEPVADAPARRVIVGDGIPAFADGHLSDDQAFAFQQLHGLGQVGEVGADVPGDVAHGVGRLAPFIKIAPQLGQCIQGSAFGLGHPHGLFTSCGSGGIAYRIGRTGPENSPENQNFASTLNPRGAGAFWGGVVCGTSPPQPSNRV